MHLIAEWGPEFAPAGRSHGRRWGQEVAHSTVVHEGAGAGGQSRYHRCVLPPLLEREETEGRGRLASLPHALEWLLDRHSSGRRTRGSGPGSANRSLPMMPATVARSRNGASISADEAALRTVAAPPVPGARRLPERGVAAAERTVVAGESREGTGDGQLRVGPEGRAVGQFGIDGGCDEVPQEELELETLRVLVVDRHAVDETVSSLADRSTAMATVS